MQAVRKFKGLIERKRPAGFHDALEKGKRRLRTPSESDLLQAPPLTTSKSEETYDRRLVSGVLAAEGVHPDPSASLVPSNPEPRPWLSSSEGDEQNILEKKRKPPRFGTPSSSDNDETKEKGHAQDPLSEAPLFLGIGAGGPDLDTVDDSKMPPEQEGVAESPTAAEFSIYDTAYQEEVDRIRAAQGKTATVYLTRRVDTKKEYKEDKNMIDEPRTPAVAGGAREGLKAMVDRARDKADAIKIEASNQRDLREERDRRKEMQQREKDLEGGYFPPPPPPKKEDETEAEREMRHEEERVEEEQRERKRDKGMRRFSAVAAKAVANIRASGSDLSSRGGEKMGRVMQKVGVGKEKDGPAPVPYEGV
jgi:GTPase SAR1 family protein